MYEKQKFSLQVFSDEHKISKYHFNFSDRPEITLTTSQNTIDHSFPKSGEYTLNVIVSGQQKEFTKSIRLRVLPLPKIEILKDESSDLMHISIKNLPETKEKFEVHIKGLKRSFTSLPIQLDIAKRKRKKLEVSAKIFFSDRETLSLHQEAFFETSRVSLRGNLIDFYWDDYSQEDIATIVRLLSKEKFKEAYRLKYLEESYNKRVLELLYQLSVFKTKEV